MKIITWNCNMAFRKKAGPVLAHKPDILVVCECECPEKLVFPEDIPIPTDMLWFGKNQHKGLGIFSYSNFRFRILDNHNQNLQLVIPIAVTDGKIDFNLFAIWANNPTDKDGTYIEQVWKAIKHYDTLLTNTKTVLIGDFNSNKIWDKQHKKGSHSDVVELLKEKEIFSAYHLYHQQAQGEEKHPTFYWYRHQDKPYHIDYCFVSQDFATKLHTVEVGDYEFWVKHSDHVPVMVTFKDLHNSESPFC